MSTNTDNYIVVNHTTGEIICTGTAPAEVIDDKPIIFQDEANNTIMVLTLQEGEQFSPDDDLNSYYENGETLPKKEMELKFSHPFVEPIESTETDDEGNVVTIFSYANRINVPMGTAVTIDNIPAEVKNAFIYDGHANTETIESTSSQRLIVKRNQEELTKIFLKSPKHHEKIISIRFIDENSEY